MLYFKKCRNPFPGKKKFVMSGKLVDTNVLIYLSKKKLKLEKIASPEDTLFISVITYMEVMGYAFNSNPEKALVEKLCSLFPTIDLNSEIVEQVIALRRNHKIKLPDAIILVSAAVHKLELLTANVTDFSNRIVGLKITNPMA
ncbi:MAG: VapC toxin family PIN domain ribonuclease [Bacteroidetes bacterium HGW-Bacteroidetes-4]|nr:MAG: VapC toxin family PIN domain ribonuclease [Bacteroidetes bacterium HGW-Bacteroidetes-4]